MFCVLPTDWLAFMLLVLQECNGQILLIFENSHGISQCINGKSYVLCYQWTTEWNAKRGIFPRSHGGTRSQKQQDSPCFLEKYICSLLLHNKQAFDVFITLGISPFLDIFRKWSDIEKKLSIPCFHACSLCDWMTYSCADKPTYFLLWQFSNYLFQNRMLCSLPICA